MIGSFTIRHATLDDVPAIIHHRRAMFESMKVGTPESLAAMRSNPGPGGTLLSEIDGAGVSFFLRRTAEGVHVVQHGGDWTGQIAASFERFFSTQSCSCATGIQSGFLSDVYMKSSATRFPPLLRTGSDDQSWIAGRIL